MIKNLVLIFNEGLLGPLFPALLNMHVVHY